MAFYPSPAGATESLLPLDTWDERGRAPTRVLADARARRRGAAGATGAGDGFECFLVPIDACYELVGLVRLHWKGFDGGEEAWEAIDAFFDGAARAQPPGRHGSAT